MVKRKLKTKKKKKTKPMSSRDKLKLAKKRLKDMGISRRRKFMHLICVGCKREFKIRTNDPSIYTKEVIKVWTCLTCKSPIKRKHKC